MKVVLPEDEIRYKTCVDNCLSTINFVLPFFIFDLPSNCPDDECARA